MDKLIKATAFAVVLFFVILAVLIGTRIDPYTIAVLAGATVGMLIATPFAVLTTYLVVRHNREDFSRESGWRYGPPPAWSMPPDWPGYSAHHTRSPHTQLNAAHESFTLPPRRRFYLIGESGQATEIEPEKVDDYLT